MDPGLASRIGPAGAGAGALFARLSELGIEALTAEDAGYPTAPARDRAHAPRPLRHR